MPTRRERPVMRCEVLLGVANASFWASWACRNLHGGLAGLSIVWAASPRDVLSASGMRRSTLLELSGMELHEVAHVRRCFAGELAHGVRHAVVTPLPGQLGHGREMPDEVLEKPRLPKAFAPRREGDVAISDGPAERLGEDARIVVKVGRFRPREIVDLSDM